MKRSFFSIFTLLIFTSLVARAQIDVVKGEGAPIRVDLGGASGSQATKILANDLANSGYFKPASSGGEYIVQGSASGSSVNAKLLSSDGTTLLSPSASGDLRRAVHKVADDIILKITEKKGFAESHIAFLSNKSGH